MSGQVPGLTWPVHPDCTTGKCIDLAAAVPVAAVKLGRECNGWPIATTTAGGRGGMVIWVPLGQGTTMCGTLLIATAGVVTDRAETDAVVMAIHASTAAVAARQREELRSAVQSRDVIGQAKGILMQRLQLTATAAFELLARASQDSNLKLWEVCSTLCSTGGLPEPRTASHRRRTPELTATFGQHSPQG